jgi:SpoVK/Ycf46/Vps4 family AAA+-type ATPase
MRVIDSWGGELVDAAAWDAVAGMAAEKRIIDSRIVAPLADPDTARRVGVNPPAAVMLFGPPGTGKTTFAKAVAGRLGWPFVELLPSKLAGPSDNLAAELRAAMEALTALDEVVVFIDEFDEIATRRETSPSTRAVVNEVLKSLPIFRARPGRLLVCATNFVTTIDPAVLRPGRFDLLIPIGPPDPEARRALWEAALARLPGASADLGDLVRASERFTPGDVELAAQRAAAAAFERARAGHSEARVSEDDLHAAIGRTRASITREVAEQFADEAAEFARD